MGSLPAREGLPREEQFLGSREKFSKLQPECVWGIGYSTAQSLNPDRVRRFLPNSDPERSLPDSAVGVCYPMTST